ncbi:MAG TPA: hypothetical protein VN213_06665 [Solirubrobacteraceae bacterium]|nr:hypothetical protein [Solirubrobacteraceae bacterium]
MTAIAAFAKLAGLPVTVTAPDGSEVGGYLSGFRKDGSPFVSIEIALCDPAGTPFAPLIDHQQEAPNGTARA